MFGLTVESAKITGELLSALAKLVKAAERSKNKSLLEVFGKLRIEAGLSARALEHGIDEITSAFKEHGIPLDQSIVEVERDITAWQFPRRLALQLLSRRMWRLATAVKDLYADIEALFVCAGEYEALVSGAVSAKDVRQEVSMLLTNDAKIADILNALRKHVHQVLSDLKA